MLLGWPKISFRFFCIILWKNPKELFDQLDICCGKVKEDEIFFFPLFIFFLNFILFFNFTILYWFCHISKWIHHRYTCVPHPEPSSILPPHTIPLGGPIAPAPSIQYGASNLDWRIVSYMILYIFQCHSPKSSHPLPLPQSPKDCSIHQCLFCCLVLCYKFEMLYTAWNIQDSPFSRLWSSKIWHFHSYRDKLQNKK